MLRIYTTTCTKEMLCKLDLVEPDRAEKIKHLKNESDRILSAGAGLLLRQALEESELSINDILILKDKLGKPHLYSKKHPTAELCYCSLSHSGNQAMCVLSDSNVGCDIQLIEKQNLNIAKKFFTKQEYMDILNFGTSRDPMFPDSSQVQRFFEYWTAKESYLKAIGQGLHIPLNSFRIDLSSGDIFRLEDGSEILTPYKYKPHTHSREYAASIVVLS